MSDTVHAVPNAAQIESWNGAAGQTWTQFQDQLDRQIDPLGQEALRTLVPATGEQLLDIGCGCGQTSWQLAQRVGLDGAVLGVDVSQSMLQAARQRTDLPSPLAPLFLHGDVQLTDLGAARFDGAFSRFGVMFCADPVAAFANVLRALKPGGRLVFVCWRSLAQNIWMRVPLEAAQPFLPATAPPDPHAPGPFALADAARLRTVLTQAGFAEVTLRAFDCLVGASDLDASLSLALRVGPLGSVLRESPALEASIAAPVRAALGRHVHAGVVRMGGAAWIVSARRSI